MGWIREEMPSLGAEEAAACVCWRQVGVCVDQQRSRVTTTHMNSAWEGPAWLAPTQEFTRGGTPFSGCDGLGGSLIQTEFGQEGKLSLPG